MMINQAPPSGMADEFTMNEQPRLPDREPTSQWIYRALQRTRLRYDWHVGLFGTINKDVDEARELWTKSSVLMKLAIVVSLFLATSSVTSLSEVVVEWKGFVLQAINLYRDWVVAPIVDIAQLFDFEYAQSAIDLIVLVSLLFVLPFLRLSFQLRATNTMQMWHKSLSVLFVLISVGVLSWVVEGDFDIPTSDSALFLGIMACTTLGVMILVCQLEMTWELSFKLRRADEQTRRHQRVVMFTPIVFALAITLVLGGVNAGLTT